MAKKIAEAFAAILIFCSCHDLLKGQSETSTSTLLPLDDWTSAPPPSTGEDLHLQRQPQRPVRAPSQHQQQQQQGRCRDRSGFYDVPIFLRITCNLCYEYLFPQTKINSPNGSDAFVRGDANSSSSFRPPPRLRSLPAAAAEGTANKGCRSLSASDCRRWKACCSAAEDCCQHQVRIFSAGTNASSDADGGGGELRCKATWDGFSCWDSGLPGSYEKKRCPEFMPRSDPSERALKYCTLNGTWFKKDGAEWTDYTPCINATYLFHLKSVYVCFAFNILSISMLLPSIGIFLTFRDLAKQARIQLHVNFFASLSLCCFSTVAWYLFVHYERLNNPDKLDTVIYRNPVWCRLISFTKTYFTSTAYFWMFCEGWYLHRLLSKAFQQSESLRSLYAIGWGIVCKNAYILATTLARCPALAAAVYCTIRSFIDNSECWVKHVGGYEWIIYTPNLLCLTLNFIFLCNILRILIFQLHAHPQEPSNFRRGLKAGIMLIPLFGLQLLLTIYRPDFGTSEKQSYEYITLAITNSQGVFVSLIFCFFNGEVMSHACRRSVVCDCIRRRSRAANKLAASHVTQCTLAEERRSDTPNSLKNRTTSCGGNSCSAEGLCLRDLSSSATSPTAGADAGIVDEDDDDDDGGRGRGGGADDPCDPGSPLQQPLRCPWSEELDWIGGQESAGMLSLTGNGRCS